eukprot:3351319-Pyramimonas_sp.AAC.1
MHMGPWISTDKYTEHARSHAVRTRRGRVCITKVTQRHATQVGSARESNIAPTTRHSISIQGHG